MKKIPLDFRIYAHYAGLASWAKGILLVDNSAGEPRHSLELTSENCAWKTKTGHDSWRTFQFPDGSNKSTELVGLFQNLADADGAIFGAFNMTKSRKGAPGNNFLQSVQLLMGTQGGLIRIAQLWVACKSGHHLAAKLKMSSVAQNRFVKGELALAGHSSLTGSFQAR